MTPFGQTLWGTLLINFLMAFIPLIPVLFILIVLLLNHFESRLKSAQSPLRLVIFSGFGIVMTLGLPGILLLALFFIPFDTLEQLAQALSPTHRVASLTEDLYNTTAPFARILGALLLVLAGAMLVRWQQFINVLQVVVTRLADKSRTLVEDTRRLGKDLIQNNPTRQEWLLILGLTLVGALLRAVYLDRPFLHDEAYTYVGFASRSLRAVVTDYSLPNNHVFHTILVFFSTQLLGVEPWAVRLPAYISGILCIPAAYFTARKLYKPQIALLAAAGVAVLPDLSSRSAEARGYMPMALLTLVIFWIGLKLIHHHNRFLWLLLALLSSIGFYTLPIMLYPFGGLLLWMALNALFGELGSEYKSRWRFIFYLFMVGIGTILLTGLLYSTILIGTGLGAFFGNGFVSPLAWDDFVTILPLRWSDLWHDLSYQTPLAAVWYLVGLGIALIFDRKLTGRKIPWLVTLLLWILADLVIQRPNPWSRLWTFLVPLLVISMAAGWYSLLVWISRRSQRLTTWVLRFSLVILLIFGLSVSVRFYSSPDAQTGLPEKVALSLQKQLQPGDLVLSVSANEPALWYYFRRHAIPWSYLNLPPQQAQRLIIITYNDENETVESILEKRQIPITQVNLSQKQTLEPVERANFTLVRINH